VNTSSTVDHGDLPIACTLGRDDWQARVARWQDLATAANPSASRDGRTLEVHFEAGPGVRAELAALAAAEQDCCSFVTWTVSEDDGSHPVLRGPRQAGQPG
jgi:hypothetical protein